MNITRENLNESSKFIDSNNNSLNWPVVFLLIFSIIGIIGNLLVCLAICFYKKLQNVTNHYLVSLAIADLLVSLIVIPFSIIQSLLDTWIFGQIMCNLWIFFDVLLCTTSILLLCAISCERYFGISNPLGNRKKSKIKVKLTILLVWLISAFLSSPIIVLGTLNKKNIFINGICTLNNNQFIIYGSILSFIIPLFILITMYILTVNKLQKATEQFGNLSNGLERHKPNRNENLNERGKSILSTKDSIKLRSSFTSLNGMDSKNKSRMKHVVNRQILMARAVNLFSRTNQKNVVKNEKKAIKVLGFVFVIFLIAWVPFAILNMLNALELCNVNPNLLNGFVWLGYISSVINPLIYNAFNKHFRYAFKCIMKFNLKELKNDRNQSKKLNDLQINKSPSIVRYNQNKKLSVHSNQDEYIHEILTSV